MLKELLELQVARNRAWEAKRQQQQQQQQQEQQQGQHQQQQSSSSSGTSGTSRQQDPFLMNQGAHDPWRNAEGQSRSRRRDDEAQFHTLERDYEARPNGPETKATYDEQWQRWQRTQQQPNF